MTWFNYYIHLRKKSKSRANNDLTSAFMTELFPLYNINKAGSQ